MEKITIVGWLWQQKDCRSHYTPEHANIWASMLHRHLTIEHRFVLFTDHPRKHWSDFDPLIEPMELWKDWRDLKRLSTGRFNPFCYVRLKAFSEEFGEILRRGLSVEGRGPDLKAQSFSLDPYPRFVSIDLDVVPLANLDSLFDHDDEFRIIRRTPLKGHEKLGTYQASMWMMNAGARRQVWKEFKGHESIVAAARFTGSDQAWLNHILSPDEKGWTQQDGVYGFIDLYRTQKFKEAPPSNARLVTFNGTIKPWEFLDGRRHDYQWVAANYRKDMDVNRDRVGAQFIAPSEGVINHAPTSMRELSQIETGAL